MVSGNILRKSKTRSLFENKLRQLSERRKHNFNNLRSLDVFFFKGPRLFSRDHSIIVVPTTSTWF